MGQWTRTTGLLLLLVLLALPLGPRLLSDGDPYEPNNTFEAATLVSVGIEYVAYISPAGDEDWFRFYVVAGQEIRADLYGEYENLPADYDLALYDPLGGLVSTSNASGLVPEQIVYPAARTGQYRAAVRGWSGAFSDTQPYTFIVTLGPLCEDRVCNGSFSSGNFSCWTTSGSPWIATYLGHDDSYSGVVGGANNHHDMFYQQIALPASVTSARLTYWWYLYTEEGIGSPSDYLFVEAQATDGTVLATLARLDNQASTGGWFQEIIDLRDYPALFGRTIRVAFRGTTNDAYFSSFYIDEVTLQVCTTAPTATPTPTATRSRTATWTAQPTPSASSTATRTTTPTPSATASATILPTPVTQTPVPPLLPDLLVTDLWLEDGAVCYQIMNAGSAEAPAGHTVALRVNGAWVATQVVGVELLGGERYRGCFGWTWQCLDSRSAVVVATDYGNTLLEENEGNNTREETWLCDAISPKIVAGPEIAAVTHSSARVSWRTDEPSSSAVRYGQEAGAFGSEAVGGEPLPVTEHQVVLGGLEPATTYHLLARSVDPSGNAVESVVLRFETASLPDESNPSVQLLDPGAWAGVVPLSAQAQDDGGVERVAFFVDGRLLFTDYTPPFEFRLDTRLFPNGAHGISARAYDRAGRWAVANLGANIANIKDLTSPRVTITAPGAAASVSRTISVTAQVSDDAGLDSI